MKFQKKKGLRTKLLSRCSKFPYFTVRATQKNTQSNRNKCRAARGVLLKELRRPVLKHSVQNGILSAVLTIRLVGKIQSACSSGFCRDQCAPLVGSFDCDTREANSTAMPAMIRGVSCGLARLPVLKYCFFLFAA